VLYELGQCSLFVAQLTSRTSHTVFQVFSGSLFVAMALQTSHVRRALIVNKNSVANCLTEANSLRKYETIIHLSSGFNPFSTSYLSCYTCEETCKDLFIIAHLYRSHQRS
jgi:hypothetical protein